MELWTRRPSATFRADLDAEMTPCDLSKGRITYRFK
jgi:translation initiation factor IF-1